MSTNAGSEPTRHGLFALQLTLQVVCAVVFVFAALAIFVAFAQAFNSTSYRQGEYFLQAFVLLGSGLGSVLTLLVAAAVVGHLGRMENKMHYLLEAMETTQDNTDKTAQLLDFMMRQRSQAQNTAARQAPPPSERS